MLSSLARKLDVAKEINKNIQYFLRAPRFALGPLLDYEEDSLPGPPGETLEQEKTRASRASILLTSSTCYAREARREFIKASREARAVFGEMNAAEEGCARVVKANGLPERM